MIHEETVLDLIERSKNLIEFVATIPVDMLDKNQLRKLTLKRSTIIDDAEVDHLAGLKRLAEESRLDSWSKKAYEEIFYKIDAALSAIDATLDVSRNIVTIVRSKKHDGVLPVLLAKVTFLVNLRTYSRGSWHAKEEKGFFVELDVDGKRTRYTMSKSGKMNWDKIVNRLVERLEWAKAHVEHIVSVKDKRESRLTLTNRLLDGIATFENVDKGEYSWHAKKFVQDIHVSTTVPSGKFGVNVDVGHGAVDEETFEDVTITISKISATELRLILRQLGCESKGYMS